MKKEKKMKYGILCVAVFIAVVIIFKMNRNTDVRNTKSAVPFNQIDNNMDHNTNNDSDEKNNRAMHFLEALSGSKDEGKPDTENNGKKQKVDDSIAKDPRNIKLRSLIEEAAAEVGDFPQFVWDPIRFTDKDIDAYTNNLERIILYNNRVKMNSGSAEDKSILKNLVSGVIKDKIEFFSSACAEFQRGSVARNEEDKKVLDSSFQTCNEVINELENKLYYYEKE